MSRQWVLIPRHRETTLGNCIPSRSPNPVDVVEFDVPHKPFTMEGFPENPYDDIVVFPCDPRLDLIASVAGRDDSEFIKLCQTYRLIPSWWFTEVSRVYKVFYAGKWYINRYATGDLSKYEKSLLRAPRNPNKVKVHRLKTNTYGKTSARIIGCLANRPKGTCARIVAEKCKVNYGYCATTLDRLRMAGMVERRPDPANIYSYLWTLVKETSCQPATTAVLADANSNPGATPASPSPSDCG